MGKKILAISLKNIPGQYYVKFHDFLKELEHPFLKKIDFILDSELLLNDSIILDYPVVAFFYRDPLRILYPKEFEYAKRIEDICIKNNIRFVNKPDALSNSVKSIQLNILRSNGFRVANFYPFNDLSELRSLTKSNYPIFIRYNAGHDSEGNYRHGLFYSFEDIENNLSNNMFESKKHFKDKIAIQWIDTKFIDGYYRRFRAFVTGSDAMKGNIYMSDDWYIHEKNSIKNHISQYEEYKFMKSDFTEDEKLFFIRANKILGFDFSAFDYSYTKDGEIIIWESNPHPALPKEAESEPFRTKITNLLANHFSNILDEQLKLNN